MYIAFLRSATSSAGSSLTDEIGAPDPKLETQINSSDKCDRRLAYLRNASLLKVHPVSITRFPLTRFSPGSGLLRNLFFVIGSG